MSKKRKSNVASDPQAERIYEWTYQWSEWNRKVIPLTECKDYVYAACKLYDLDPPTVSAAPCSQRYSAHWEDKDQIQLTNSHQNPAIALHEVAHYIVHTLNPRAVGHGPTFAGVYLFLLVEAGIAPAEAIYASARKAGIKWSKKATPEFLVQ